MSIIIRGMEMPKSCDVCPFVGTNDDLMSDDYRYLYCGFPYMGQYVTDYEASRHPDCPIGSLPKGHGRLIDADALQAKFELMENALAEHGRPYSFAFKDGGEMCAEWWTVQDALAREPTIIEAEGGNADGN